MVNILNSETKKCYCVFLMMSYMNLIKINQELNGDIVTDTDTSFSEIRVF